MIINPNMNIASVKAESVKKKKSDAVETEQDGFVKSSKEDDLLVNMKKMKSKKEASEAKEKKEKEETAESGSKFDQAFEENKVTGASSDVTVKVMKDGGLEMLADLIRSAKKSIDLKIYIMTGNEETTMSALREAAEKGIKGRIMLEQTPFYWIRGGTEDNPSQAVIDEFKKYPNFEVKWTNPAYSFSKVTHEKSMVIDGEKGIILTGNLGGSAHTNLDMGAILLKDKKNVGDLQTVFDFDFDRKNEQGQDLMNMISDTNLVISPNNARDKILGLIDSAKESLVVMNQAVSDEGVTMKILEKHREGVDVSLIVSDPLIGEGNLSSASFLKSKGVDVKYLENPYLHAKAITVDAKDDDHSDDMSYIGSQNFSTAAINKNREMGIIFQDPDNNVLDVITNYSDKFEVMPDKQISTNNTYTSGIIKKGIKLAEKSIILSTNMMTDESIAKALVKAKADGKDVKVIIPKDLGGKPINDKAIQILQDGGVEVKLAAKEDNIEGTTMVFDGERAVTSNDALTKGAFSKSHNYGMIDIDPKEVKDFEKLLLGQFNGEKVDSKGIDEDIIAPDVKKQKIMGELKNAKKVIEIESKDVNDKDVAALLKQKVKEGVTVKVICKESKDNHKYMDELVAAGGKVVYQDETPIGTNYINIDNKELIVGGGTLGWKSLKDGKGIGVIIKDNEIFKKTDPDFSKAWVKGNVNSATQGVTFEKKTVVLRDGIDDAILSTMFARAKYGVPMTIKAETVIGTPLEKVVANVNRITRNIASMDTSTDDGKKKLAMSFNTFDNAEALEMQKALAEKLATLPPGEELVKFIPAKQGEVKNETVVIDGKTFTYAELKDSPTSQEVPTEGEGGEGGDA